MPVVVSVLLGKTGHDVEIDDATARCKSREGGYFP